MNQPQQLARVRQASHPRIERGIRKPIPETSQDEGKHQGHVRRVRADHAVGGEVAAGADDRDAALAEPEVEVVVEERGGDVADEGGEEDQGDDGVADVVVFLKLGRVSGRGFEP